MLIIERTYNAITVLYFTVYLSAFNCFLLIFNIKTYFYETHVKFHLLIISNFYQIYCTN